MHINVTKHKLCKRLAIATMVIMASGCATNGSFNSASSNDIPASQWLNTSGTVTFFSAEHSQLIETAGAGEIVTLGKTPWGGSTRLKVESPYFSATGKPCFATTIKTATGGTPSTLCKYSKGNWGVTRAITVVDSGVENSGLVESSGLGDVQ